MLDHLNLLQTDFRVKKSLDNLPVQIHIKTCRKTALRNFSAESKVMKLCNFVHCRVPDYFIAMFLPLALLANLVFFCRLLINPCEVENCLKEHPAVLECAVVSSPHLMQQTIKAFVVLSSGFKDKNQEEMIKELQDHVSYNASGWMRPEKVEFVDDLPKTITGKVSRRELRNREWNIQ